MEEEAHEEAKEEVPRDETEIPVEKTTSIIRGFPYCHLVVFSFSMS
jgi:hypothetical protein